MSTCRRQGWLGRGAGISQHSLPTRVNAAHRLPDRARQVALEAAQGLEGSLAFGVLAGHEELRRLGYAQLGHGDMVLGGVPSSYQFAVVARSSHIRAAASSVLLLSDSTSWE